MSVPLASKQRLDPDFCVFMPQALISKSFEYLGSEAFSLCSRICKLFHSAIFEKGDGSYSGSKPLLPLRRQWHLCRCISFYKSYSPPKKIIQEYRKALFSSTSPYSTCFKQNSQDCLEIVLPEIFNTLFISNWHANTHPNCIRVIYTLIGENRTNTYSVDQLARFSHDLLILKSHLESVWFQYFEQLIDRFAHNEDLPAPEIICAFLYAFVQHKNVESEYIKKCVTWVKDLVSKKYLIVVPKFLVKENFNFISFLLTLNDIVCQGNCHSNKKYYPGIADDLAIITANIPRIDKEVQDIIEKTLDKHKNRDQT